MPQHFPRCLLLALGLWVGGAWSVPMSIAQTAGTPSGTTIETTPLPELAPNATAPASPAAPATSAAPATPAAPPKPLPMGVIESPALTFPDVPAGMSIAPSVQQTSLPDSFSMIAKPALVMHGQSTWDHGFQKLKEAFDKLKAAAQSAGMSVTGYPVTIFIGTTENDFRFDAMLPIDKVPNQLPANFPIDMHIGSTPSGHAMRFVHQAPYDEIDNAYEQITAFLDAKEIDVRDSFIEEYVTLGASDLDPATQINIIVQPKD